MDISRENFLVAIDGEAARVKARLGQILKACKGKKPILELALDLALGLEEDCLRLRKTITEELGAEESRRILAEAEAKAAHHAEYGGDILKAPSNDEGEKPPEKAAKKKEDKITSKGSSSSKSKKNRRNWAKGTTATTEPCMSCSHRGIADPSFCDWIRAKCDSKHEDCAPETDAGKAVAARCKRSCVEFMRAHRADGNKVAELVEMYPAIYTLLERGTVGLTDEAKKGRYHWDKGNFYEGTTRIDAKFPPEKLEEGPAE